MRGLILRGKASNKNKIPHSSLRSQKKGMWFVFRAKPEKRTPSSASRERSERVTK
ncbi:MAG: hypothetical protein U5L45_20670 [Saprospiraceae bacterium]|nr:hypothetical protein [Saprospiraceae bacterium]